MRIYLDNAATTPLHPEVLEYMLPLMKEHFGNPSSVHFHGRQTKALVEEARKKIANVIHASIGEIFFTSSATEANNLIIQAAVRDLGVKRIITSPIEHHCVLHTVEHVCGCHEVELEYLSVDQFGALNLDELDSKLAENKGMTLVCLMHANNEMGALADVKKIGEICKKHDVLFQCDAVQTVGKYDINVNELNLSFMSGSGHKFYGPKGIGFVYIKGDNKISPLIFGGAQERNMRAGTENTYGIAGIGKALELCMADMVEHKEYITSLRTYLMKSLQDRIPNVKIVSPEDGHYCILNVAFPKNEKSEMMMFNLDIHGISASAGSACSSGVAQASHVLEAIGLSADYQAIRFSISHYNTKDEMDFLLEKLEEIL